MLISTTEELRLYSPANAIDHIESIMGFLDSSEQDFLLEKLGQPLYDSLVEYYQTLRSGDDGISEFIKQVTDGATLPPYARLLTVAQRVVTFDALGRSVNIQAVSVNGSGVNMVTADDYGKADREAVRDYKTTCITEAHVAVNRLLVLLEQWTKDVAAMPDPSPDPLPVDADSPEAVAAAEKKEIAEKWKESRFFYLAAGLAIPSATVLQEYLDIYDSREKFIQMLPDLRTIQEDVLGPIFGEDFIDYLIEVATKGTDDKLMNRLIHKLRKCVARHLEERTKVIKVDDARRTAAHNEAVRCVTDLSEYLQTHQPDLDEKALEAFKDSPLYVAPATPEASAGDDYEPEFQNNAEGSVMFVTPALS